MASPKRIGFYLSENKFYFVESSDNNLLKVITSAPFYTEEKSSSEDLRLIALIQRTLREQNITQNEVRFSIPQSEVIIRSFVIPQMKSSELIPVVDFELKKHIPFDLKDFSYTFNTLQVIENKVKKIRVLVAATRKALLERYELLLNQSKLNVAVCEPAPFGLVRVLFAKKVVAPNARFALIHIGQAVCRILFVNEGMVLFIREFQLSQSGIPAETREEEHLIKARFINEVQNSLEFFTRAHEQIAVSQIIIIKHEDDRQYDEWLGEEVSIPKKIVDVKSLIGAQIPDDQIGILYAFGASLADPRSPTIFNLSRKAFKKSSSPSLIQGIDFREYIRSIQVGVGVMVLLIGLFAFFGIKIAGLQQHKDQLTGQQEGMAEQTNDDIQKKIDRSEAKLKQYSSIVLKNRMSEIFLTLGKDIPKGVWLKKIEIRAITKNVKTGENVVFKTEWDISFEANVYTKDQRQEIRVVNNFMSRLKKDQVLSKFVKNINLVSMTQEQIDDHAIIVISLKCV